MVFKLFFLDVVTLPVLAPVELPLPATELLAIPPVELTELGDIELTTELAPELGTGGTEPVTDISTYCKHNLFFYSL